MNFAVWAGVDAGEVAEDAVHNSKKSDNHHSGMEGGD